MYIQSYRDLEVWKTAVDLADLVYDATENFPNREWYGLGGQIRKSAVSVPSNISEGSGRASTKELIQFLHIAKGSLFELETQVLIANRRNYLIQLQHDEIMNLTTRIGKMITRLIQSLQK